MTREVSSACRPKRGGRRDHRSRGVNLGVEGVGVVEVDSGQRSVHGRKEFGGRWLVLRCGAQLQRAYGLGAVRRHLEHERLQRTTVHRAQEPLDVLRDRIPHAAGPDHVLHPLIIANRPRVAGAVRVGVPVKGKDDFTRAGSSGGSAECVGGLCGVTRGRLGALVGGGRVVGRGSMPRSPVDYERNNVRLVIFPHNHAEGPRQ